MEQPIINVHFVVLTNGEDADSFVISKEMNDWADAAEIGTAEVPEDILAHMRQLAGSDDQLTQINEIAEHGIEVTSGSGYNDILLAFAGCVRTLSARTLIDEVSRQGWNLMEDIHGCIY